MKKTNTLMCKVVVIQNSNGITNHSNLFSWDIKNTERWVPFFTPDLVIRPGQVNCACIVLI
jgi:hypothetical protein